MATMTATETAITRTFKRTVGGAPAPIPADTHFWVEDTNKMGVTAPVPDGTQTQMDVVIYRKGTASGTVAVSAQAAGVLDGTIYVTMDPLADKFEWIDP